MAPHHENALPPHMGKTNPANRRITPERNRDMASLQVRTEYQPVCNDCRNTYAEPFDNESEAMLFIREFPTCSSCEGTA